MPVGYPIRTPGSPVALAPLLGFNLKTAILGGEGLLPIAGTSTCSLRAAPINISLIGPTATLRAASEAVALCNSLMWL